MSCILKASLHQFPAHFKIFVERRQSRIGEKFDGLLKFKMRENFGTAAYSGALAAVSWRFSPHSALEPLRFPFGDFSSANSSDSYSRGVSENVWVSRSILRDGTRVISPFHSCDIIRLVLSRYSESWNSGDVYIDYYIDYFIVLWKSDVLSQQNSPDSASSACRIEALCQTSLF